MYSVDNGSDNSDHADRSKLSIDSIKAFADSVDIGKIKLLVDRQLKYNMDIAYEGIRR